MGDSNALESKSIKSEREAAGLAEKSADKFSLGQRKTNRGKI